jgi:hypothetical protein
MTISSAALCFHRLFASLAVACTGAPCPRSSDASPWVSVRYRTTGAVGLGQEVRYFEDGRIRLYGANLESYCSRVSPATSAELADVLSSEDLPTELDSLGSRLRYRDCFLAEEVTITLDGRSATARVDALEGELLSLVGRLEDASRERFGAKHQFDVVAQATERACLSALELEATSPGNSEAHAEAVDFPVR